VIEVLGDVIRQRCIPQRIKQYSESRWPMRKTRYYHESAKKDPSLNRVSYTFLDGKTISEAAFLDAGIELIAFFAFNGLQFDTVRFGLLGYRGIPVNELVAPRAATTREALEAVAEKAASSKPPRIYEDDLTDAEFWSVQQGKTSFEKIAVEHNRREILSGLQYLAKRKDDWTLLGIKSEAALAKVVRDCFGPAWVKRMQKTGCLSARLVRQLLARKSQIGVARITTATQHRTVSRAEAAVKGHKKRQDAKEPRLRPPQTKSCQ
jgi:hypothetical protein